MRMPSCARGSRSRHLKHISSPKWGVMRQRKKMARHHGTLVNFGKPRYCRDMFPPQEVVTGADK